MVRLVIVWSAVVLMVAVGTLYAGLGRIMVRDRAPWYMAAIMFAVTALLWIGAVVVSFVGSR